MPTAMPDTTQTGTGAAMPRTKTATGLPMGVRVSIAAVAVGLFGWMAFLFCAGPTITFGPVFSDEPASVTVTCSPLVGVIQDRYYYDDLDTSSSYHGHYE